MSVQITSPVWLIDFGSPAQKMVALYLADCANEDGTCWPSSATIAARCFLSKDTVKSALAELTSAGWITRSPRYRKDGSHTSSLTTWNVAKLDSASRKARAAMVRDVEIAKQEEAEIEKRALDIGGCKSRTGVGVTIPPHPREPFHPTPGNHSTSNEPEENRNGTENTPIVPCEGTSSKRSRSKRSVPLVPSPEARRLIQSFADMYAKRFSGLSYHPDATRDTLAAQSLLDSGVTPEEAAKRFDDCTRSKGFHCKRVLTVVLLAKLWNETGGEIAMERKQTGTPDKNPLGDEWMAQLEEERRMRDAMPRQPNEKLVWKRQDRNGAECTQPLTGVAHV